MTDDMLKALARNGGVVGINFGAGFVNPKDARATMANINSMAAAEPNLTGKALDDFAAKEYEREQLPPPHPSAATIDDVAPGRFGLNIVAGWNRAEYQQMGDGETG